MGPLSFSGMPALYSEAGACEKISQICGSSAGVIDRWVVVTDDTLIKLGVTAPLVQSLETVSKVTLFSGVRPEPEIGSVDTLVDLIRETNSQGLIALGGGSVMDVAKLASVVMESGLRASDCVLGKVDLSRSSLFKVMIPTTAGTGSEVTSTGVYSNESGNKVWAWGVGMRPDWVIHDPKLTQGLPVGLTAATGLDALIHAMEAWSGNRSNFLVEMFASQAITLVTQWLPRVLQDPLDLTGRANMLLAASFAGVAIDNGGTGVAHGIGHSLGSLHKIHHGTAVTIGMAATLAWNIEMAPERYLPIARHLGIAVDSLPDWFDEFIRDCQVDCALDWKVDSNRFIHFLGAEENRPMMQNNAFALDLSHNLHLSHLVLNWIDKRCR